MLQYKFLILETLSVSIFVGATETYFAFVASFLDQKGRICVTWLRACGLILRLEFGNGEELWLSDA